ncbi:MAG: hypothetical protein ACI808_000460 [Paraglaciecola sp.]
MLHIATNNFSPFKAALHDQRKVLVNEDDLAKILKKMYFESKKGETATNVHLFGIKYADEISASRCSPKNIAKRAGIPETYGTEINKGRNLSRFVKVK